MLIGERRTGGILIAALLVVFVALRSTGHEAVAAKEAAEAASSVAEEAQSAADEAKQAAEDLSDRVDALEATLGQ